MKGTLAERLAARREQQVRATRSDLGAAIELYSPKLVRPSHLAPVLRLLDRAMREPVRATIAAPPRHGKTETVLHGAVRMLRWYPERIVAFASYSGTIAKRRSRRARDIAAAAGLWTSSASNDRNAWDPAASVGFWQTPQRGGLIAVGRGGAITGEGVHLLIVDDPYANREEAESPVIREKAWDWYQGVLLPRMEPGGSVIVTHQRWHPDDMIGTIHGPEGLVGYEDISLPAIGDAGALWPERYTETALGTIRADVGEYNWWSQYQQNPRPRGGRLFNDPTFYTAPHTHGQIVLAADLASSEDTRADYTAAVALLVWRDTETGLLRGDVLDVIRGQWEVPDAVQHLLRFQARWPGAPLVVEAQGGEGRAAAQTIGRVETASGAVRVVAVRAVQDKFTRAQPVAAAWNQGRCRLPLGLDPGFQRTVCGFTGVRDKHDDDVDALAHAWNYADKALAALPPKPTKPLRQRSMTSSPF